METEDRDTYEALARKLSAEQCRSDCAKRLHPQLYTEAPEAALIRKLIADIKGREDCDH